MSLSNIKQLTSFIIKTKNPCINCIHYIKYHLHNSDNYENKIGICRLFGEQNLVTGHVEFENALSCRINESQCGKEGRYFTTKNIKY